MANSSLPQEQKMYDTALNLEAYSMSSNMISVCK